MTKRRKPDTITIPPGAKRLVGPITIKPAKAVLVSAAPEDGDWLSEIKWDGYRMIVSGQQDRVRITSSNGLDWTSRLPELAEELTWLVDRQAVIDGEVVALRGDGVSSFESLKEALGRHRTADLIYYAFDILSIDGWDIRPCRQDDRSHLLASLLRFHPSERVLLSETFEGALALHEAACQNDLEGVMIKSAEAPYQPGRSDAWRKLKCGGRQEFIVAGFTDPAGSRVGLGALMLAYMNGGKLTYAGAVGTGKGFTRHFLADLRRQLGEIEVVREGSQNSLAPVP